MRSRREEVLVNCFREATSRRWWNRLVSKIIRALHRTCIDIRRPARSSWCCVKKNSYGKMITKQQTFKDLSVHVTVSIFSIWLEVKGGCTLGVVDHWKSNYNIAIFGKLIWLSPHLVCLKLPMVWILNTWLIYFRKVFFRVNNLFQFVLHLLASPQVIVQKKET